MHHRLVVLVDVLAAAGYAECARVSQCTDHTLIAFWQYLEHWQPQHEACGIELSVRLVTELVVLEASMAELARIDNTEVNRLGSHAWCVAAHLTEVQVLLNRSAAA